jgi:hypothetical protein
MRKALLAVTLLLGPLSLIGCNPLNMIGPSSASAAGAPRQTVDSAAEQQAKRDKEIAEREEQAKRDREIAERQERERNKTNIETVLAEDAKTNVGAQSVAEVVERMRDIDTSACPGDFRSAYLTHIHAWQDLADVERNVIAFKKEANSDGVVVEAFIRGFLGDPLGKVNEIEAAQTQLQRDYKEARSSIRQTFNHVEDVALSYGATVPK